MPERFEESMPSGSINLTSPVLATSPDAGFLDRVDFDTDQVIILAAIQGALHYSMLYSKLSLEDPYGPLPIAMSLQTVFGIQPGIYDVRITGFLCRVMNLLHEHDFLTPESLFESLKNLAEQRKRARQQQQ